MANHEAVTRLGVFVAAVALRDRSSRYTRSFVSKSSMSMTNPQNGCGISLYVRNSRITSRSDGSSDEISCANFWRWCDDMRGKGAEVSRPSIGRISCRMSIRSLRSVGDDCSRRRAGIEFCPKYRSAAASESSKLSIARGQLSWRSALRLASRASEKDRALFRDKLLSGATESRLPVEERFGLYEQSWGCSLFTQFSQGCLLSHFTLR